MTSEQKQNGNRKMGEAEKAAIAAQLQAGVSGEHFKIDVQTMQEVVNILQQLPFAQVIGVMQKLMQLRPEK